MLNLSKELYIKHLQPTRVSADQGEAADPSRDRETCMRQVDHRLPSLVGEPRGGGRSLGGLDRNLIWQPGIRSLRGFRCFLGRGRKRSALVRLALK